MDLRGQNSDVGVLRTEWEALEADRALSRFQCAYGVRSGVTLSHCRPASQPNLLVPKRTSGRDAARIGVQVPVQAAWPRQACGARRGPGDNPALTPRRPLT